MILSNGEGVGLHTNRGATDCAANETSAKYNCYHNDVVGGILPVSKIDPHKPPDGEQGPKLSLPTLSSWVKWLGQNGTSR